jgi:hypothetical protein
MQLCDRLSTLNFFQLKLFYRGIAYHLNVLTAQNQTLQVSDLNFSTLKYRGIPYSRLLNQVGSYSNSLVLKYRGVTYLNA